MEKYTSNSEKETKNIAKKIYLKLSSEEKLILLIGDLGSGKTIFVKGIAEAMGIKENITSPTFGIKMEYPGMIHYDLYFLNEKIDISSLLSEELEENIVVMEWGDKLPRFIRKKAKIVEISKDGNKRIIISK